MKMISTPKLIFEYYLTEDERASGIWQNLKGHLDGMLEKKRRENDNPKLTDVETATLRGHIECLKAVISLGNTPPAMTAPKARPGPRPDYGARYG